MAYVERPESRPLPAQALLRHRDGAALLKPSERAALLEAEAEAKALVSVVKENTRSEIISRWKAERAGASSLSSAAIESHATHRIGLLERGEERRKMARARLKSVIESVVPTIKTIALRVLENVRSEVETVEAAERILAGRFGVEHEASPLLLRLKETEQNLERDAQAIGSGAGLLTPSILLARVGIELHPTDTAPAPAPKAPRKSRTAPVPPPESPAADESADAVAIEAGELESV